ncbi:MAG: MotA/TolQ/ExbB proton channel family protein [Gammaproteobacteria bacterium]|nr:MotA/TolQ/ExbB proton channel family protein [Gammaproteobacteria bacterium]NNF61624.1 MotA/TolQ/ExbB proton channel family protein [Gammaproteobacteria bacterium]NNM20570.1 MotA/TolQ/ExbB proton channel family protein [Gammaproteobacteria bacterium]
MSRLVITLAALLAVAPAMAQSSLQELLEQVQQSREQVSAEVEARLRQFRQQRDQQQALLRDVQAQLSAANGRSDELTARFDANELELEQMENTLRVQTGDMGELFGVVRQYAGDATGALNSSLVSAQLGERIGLLRRLSAAKNVPSPEDLNDFHLLMLQEMAQSGKVVRFDTTIVNAAGEPTAADVVRVGTFNLISGDKFLRYETSTDSIQELARQPAARYRKDAANLYQADMPVTAMAVDPTAGALLGLLIQAPGPRERIAQGGPVGYIIIVLGTLGLLIGVYRLVYLGGAGARIKRQLDAEQPNENNALGRILGVYNSHKRTSAETLELKLDEAIMKETPKLEKWQTALKVIAAVAPLLGLLGTVVGMIQTFQSITLFGTGDPKLMADGISKALVTTMLGLLVAIPMVLLHSLVASRSKNLIEILEEQSAGIIAEQAEKEA